MFSAFDSTAPVEVGVIVLPAPLAVTSILDVPVYVKFVAVDIDKTVPVVLVNTILPVDPKAMERVLLLFEENNPVVSV
jgi:hypothetical protein